MNSYQSLTYVNLGNEPVYDIFMQSELSVHKHDGDIMINMMQNTTLSQNILQKKKRWTYLLINKYCME